jgi:hypothetical protein
MGIPGSANLLMLGGGAQAYQIEQSLRFDGSSYLDFTPSTGGDATEGTFSAWVKKASTTSLMYLFSSSLDSNTANTLELVAYVSDEIRMFDKHSGSTRWTIDTSAVYRDPSSWYHILYVKDTSNATSTDRIKLFVNGVRVTDFSSSSFPSSGVNGVIGSANKHRIGARAPGADASPLEGYMAEVHYLDGISVTDAEDFGEYDDNGVWRPIEYTGSYGTNGFYLKFDPSATNGIGHDHSGNGNNFTPTGFTTSGTGTDVMSDTPTNNFATLNPLATRRTATIWGGGAYADGNLIFYNTDTSFRHTLSTIQVPTGKWYVEIRPLAYGSAYGSICGLMLESLEGSPDSSDNFTLYFQSNGNLNIEGTNQTTFTTNSDVFSIAVDNTVSPVQVVVRKNDTIVGSNPYSFTANEPFSFWTRSVYGAYHGWNFGAQGFTYTPPSGYKALSTANLPAPDIADGSEYFDAVLWTGNQTARTISMNSTFTPDFIWIKNRTSGYNHSLQDVVRGFGPSTKLTSNTTAAENSANTEPQAGYVDSAAAGSFDIDASATATWYHNNLNSNAYVGWCWDAGGSGSSNTAGSITSTVSANPTAGFSIVSYTGTGANATVGHGLGVAPQFFFGRNRDDTGGLLDWIVYHESVGNTARLKLNTTDSTSTSSTFFQNTSPSSTVITIGTSNDINKSGDDYIMYCFAEVEGYSKFGSYVGTNTSDGPFVYCGFKPRWIMVKSYTTGGSTAYSWSIIDTARSSYNIERSLLRANASVAENTAQTADVDILSNGFKPRYSPNETNGPNTYIFAAFAEHPFGGDGVSPATAR